MILSRKSGELGKYRDCWLENQPSAYAVFYVIPNNASVGITNGVRWYKKWTQWTTWKPAFDSRRRKWFFSSHAERFWVSLSFWLRGSTSEG